MKHCYNCSDRNNRFLYLFIRERISSDLFEFILCHILIASLTVDEARSGKKRRLVLFFPPLSPLPPPAFRKILSRDQFSATSDFYILNWLREIFHALNTVICLFRQLVLPSRKLVGLKYLAQRG